MPVIEFSDVSKTFSRVTGRMLLRSHVNRWLKPGRKELFWALKHVSFQAPAGATTALVGSSGSGKSTLISLVMTFNRPTEGRILVDGQNLTNVRLRDYRGHLGVVGMRERVRARSGKFELNSEPGGGTTVAVELPIAN